MSKRSRKGRAPTEPPPPRATTPRRKLATQVAGLCLDATGERLLLITSRDTGRWIIPKGWAMRGRSLRRSAMLEAWEEAGVEGCVGRAEIGRFQYDKLDDKGFAIPVEAHVFGIAVRGLADRFPEAGQRERRWFTPAEAAPLVAEEGLQALIRDLPGMVADGLMERIAATGGGQTGGGQTGGGQTPTRRRS